MTDLAFRLVRKWAFDEHLRLGDLRAIIAECDRRGLADDALVSVDAQGEWVTGVDGKGNPSPPYPKGDGGHYVTRVEVDGQVRPKP